MIISKKNTTERVEVTWPPPPYVQLKQKAKEIDNWMPPMRKVERWTIYLSTGVICHASDDTQQRFLE